MKCNEQVREFNRATFCEATPAELNAVQGGFLAILIGVAGKALANYLTKLATEPDYDDIPIEPLT